MEVMGCGDGRGARSTHSHADRNLRGAGGGRGRAFLACELQRVLGTQEAWGRDKSECGARELSEAAAAQRGPSSSEPSVFLETGRGSWGPQDDTTPAQQPRAPLPSAAASLPLPVCQADGE